MKKTVILIALSIILTAVCVLPAFAAPTSITVDLRIEGKTENLFYDKVTTNNSLNFNVASILMLADVQSEKLSIDGLSNGYITAISGDAVGQTENGLDTFVIKVNGNYLPYDQISSYQLNDGDDILVYYGDEFGRGVMIPMVDTNKLDQGYLRFFCEIPTEDGKGVTTKNIIGASVTWYCDDVPFQYVTDAQGGFYLEKAAFTSGTHKIEINLYDTDGTPLLLRLEPNYTVDVAVGIGDSYAVYFCAAAALVSLLAGSLVLASLKKKKI
jgi:hypothetical protein